MLRLLEKVLKMEKGVKGGWLKVINLLLLQADHDVIIKLQDWKEINVFFRQWLLNKDISSGIFGWTTLLNSLLYKVIYELTFTVNVLPGQRLIFIVH